MAQRVKQRFLANVRIGAVPDPGVRVNRDYSPKGSEIPGLNDKVWESYRKGETMVIACPPEMEEFVRGELLKAKNWLNYSHRDADPKVEVRGLERAFVQIVTHADINRMPNAQEKMAYRKLIPEGQVGVRFKARPPMRKGGAITRERQQAATRPPTRATRPARVTTSTRPSDKDDSQGAVVPGGSNPFRN